MPSDFLRRRTVFDPHEHLGIGALTAGGVGLVVALGTCAAGVGESVATTRSTTSGLRLVEETLDEALHTTWASYANPFDHAGAEPANTDRGACVTEQRDDSHRFQRRVPMELFAYCPCLSVRLSDVFIPTSSVLTEPPVPDLHGSDGVLRLDREDATRTYRDVVDVAVPSKRYIVEHAVTASHQRVEDGADPLLAFSSDAERLRAPSSSGCLRREG